MSFQISANTYHLNSYLTELGRNYLFGFDDKTKTEIRFDQNNQDLFLPKSFSVNDTDVNYKSSEKLSNNDIPALTGNKSELNLRTIANAKRKNFIVNSKGFNSNVTFNKYHDIIKDISGNTLEVKVNLEQVFENINSGNKKFRIFVIDSKTDFSNYIINGFSNQNNVNINKYSKIVELDNYTNNYTTQLLITSNSTIIEGANKKITLGIEPMNNCDIGMIPEIEILVVGVIPQTVGIGFTASTIQVNNIPNQTSIDYITLKLTNKIAKKQKIANVNIKLPIFFPTLRNSPISIELLNSFSNGDVLSEIPILYSKDYISTLMEQKRDIPLTFDLGNDFIAFKIEKPYLNIQKSATTSELQVVIDDLKNQINQNNTQINTLQTQVNNLIADIASNIEILRMKQNELDTVQSNLDSLNQNVINLVNKIANNYMSGAATTSTRNKLSAATNLDQRIVVAQDAINNITIGLYISKKPGLQDELNAIKNAKLSYENHINNIITQMNSFNNNITNDQNQITSISSQITTLQNDNTNFNNQITSIEAQIAQMTLDSNNIIFTLTSTNSSNIYINTINGYFKNCTYELKL